MRKSSYLGDKALVIAGLAGVIACAWAYLVPASLDMYGRMDGAAAWMMEATWDARYLLLIFLMWAAMMVAMMLPSALPTILIFHRAVRNDPKVRSPARRMFAFAAGYIVAWFGFSVGGIAAAVGPGRGGAAVAHDGERQPVAGWCDPDRGGGLPVDAAQVCVPAALPLAAGVPRRALAARHARRAAPGLRHGLYCVGCCWALMLLLFVGGVMSLLWIGGITAFVLLEKLAPYGAQGGRLSGLALVLAGAWVLTSA